VVCNVPRRHRMKFRRQWWTCWRSLYHD